MPSTAERLSDPRRSAASASAIIEVTGGRQSVRHRRDDRGVLVIERLAGPPLGPLTSGDHWFAIGGAPFALSLVTRG